MIFFWRNSTGTTDYPYVKQNKTKQNLDLYSAPYTKLNSNWLIALNLKPKTINHLAENTGENLCDFGLGKDFLDMISKFDK